MPSKRVVLRCATFAKPMESLDISNTASMCTDEKVPPAAARAVHQPFAGLCNPDGRPSIARPVKDNLNAVDEMRKAARLRSPNGALTHGL